ncbi:hypothetical protein, partial [Proteus mirabilis]
IYHLYLHSFSKALTFFITPIFFHFPVFISVSILALFICLLNSLINPTAIPIAPISFHNYDEDCKRLYSINTGQ